MTEEAELLIEGRIFTGWKSLRVTREMERMASDFDIIAAGSWPEMGDQPIMPFQPVQIRLGGVVVLTGYIDEVAPSLDDRQHEIRISGRSKTADLVDCTPELRGSELRGATLEAVARALAQPFGVVVRSEVDAGEALLSEAMLDPGETAFEAIERLCRLRSILATDAADGALVLTRAGSLRAKDALEEGRNIKAGKSQLNGSKRFSRYVVQAQKPTAAAMSPGGDGDEGDEDVGVRPNAGVGVNVLGQAEDPGVTRYRPRIMKAEAAMNATQARARAVWAATTAKAKSIQATILVQGWLQTDGTPWQINQLVSVRSPTLLMDDEALIVGVSYQLDDRQGRTTELTVGPPEAWTPEPKTASPSSAGRSSGRGAGAGSNAWVGVGTADGRPAGIR